jgi:excisionase family DNA binding protein
MSEAEDTYTLAQAAKVLRLSEPEIIQLITEGVLAGAMDEGGQWRIPRRAVHDRLGNRLAVKPPCASQDAPMPREADFYTRGEAARLLGMSEYTVLSLLTSGQLAGQQDEQAHWWIPASAVDDAVRRSRGTDAPPDPSAEETIAMPPVTPTGSADKPASEEETIQFVAAAGPVPRTPSTYTEEVGRTEGEQVKDHETQHVTVGEAAKLLGVHRNTVHNRIKAGRIKAHKVIEGDREFYHIDRDSLGVGRPSAVVRHEGAQRTFEGHELAQVIADRLEVVVQDYALELGDVREQLGEERAKREQAEEENQRLREELEAERSKGFWRRLFGG